MADRYGRDVLATPRTPPAPPSVPCERGLVVECATSGYCGEVMGVEKTTAGWAAVLEDRHGTRRLFPLDPGAFLLDGRPVTLVRPSDAGGPTVAAKSASGSLAVTNAPARVAAPSRIWVEGLHDAELVEKIWGHDLRVEGVVVEPLHGADDLIDRLAEFDPSPNRRVGVLLDHLVPGSKESRIADAATARFGDSVAIAGHPFVDIWAAVKPAAIGIAAWPDVPPGLPWKEQVMIELGWSGSTGDAWRRILASVSSYRDLEPTLLGRVELLIDFVTA